MLSLAKCSRAYGQADIRSDAPDVEIHRNVLFDQHGLYDWRRRLVPLSGYFQGVRLPDRALGEPLQPRTTEIDPGRMASRAPDDRYLWGGRLTSHYGHFLLDTLSRLWILSRYPHPRPKILFWCDEAAEHCLSCDFARVIFRSLDIRPDDLVFPEQPILLREVIVPAPAFECNSFAHLEFGQFMREISRQLAPPSNGTDGRPTYFTKQALPFGVARVVNEASFTDRLDRAGVRVISPEQHPFLDQVGFWADAGIVTGYLGSAMHTALFYSGKRLACLNHERQVYSNQIMIDLISGHAAKYYTLEDDLDSLGAADGFHLNFRLRHPIQAAEAWLRVIDRLADEREVQPSAFGIATVDHRAYLDEPFGRNLSRGRPADQSSIFPPHSVGASTQADAGRAVDGSMHDRYAFHTLYENNPWWQVEFGPLMSIYEVRIFNRLDIGNENSRRFRILTSDDGEIFVERHRREGDPFGLPDGRPYRWRCEQLVTARVVRIQLLGEAYFHLKQVEVFGEEAGADVPPSA